MICAWNWIIVIESGKFRMSLQEAGGARREHVVHLGLVVQGPLVANWLVLVGVSVHSFVAANMAWQSVAAEVVLAHPEIVMISIDAILL